MTRGIVLAGLTSCRERAGLTQTQLAMRLDLTRQAISRWEQGLAAPTAAMLPQIARELDCGIEDLFIMEPGVEEGFVRDDGVLPPPTDDYNQEEKI